MKGKEIRQSYLKYFQSKGHTIVASSALVPHDDPTILFTNAGMNQFKSCFLGTEKRSYTRATTAQKCMRISGKHNDFENVGVTARHHTFFEMMGNFSFGDYFKADAIKYAWEYVTTILKLSPTRLWVSIYEKDDEAGKLWQEIAGVSPDRILRLSEKDNFWTMGDTGPCGPCSEIHYFLGEDESTQSEAGFHQEDGSYLEIWNLVFMQYDRSADGTLTPLPKPSVDTGMGLERVASILQGVSGNYESDLVYDIIAVCERLSGYKYESSSYQIKDLKNDIGYARNVAMRVIADHSRAAAFLIADGVTPSSDGRGYVLRRLLRRAARHGRVLNLASPFLTETTAQVVTMFGDVYPELLEAKNIIYRVVKAEEKKFSETLDTGLSILNKEVEKLRPEELFSGRTAFLLHDTFGFPLDLTEDALKAYSKKVDTAEYETAMTAQKSRSREERKAKDLTFSSVKIEGEKTEFLGYKELETEAPLLQIVQLEGPGSPGSEASLLFSATPFYSESGGQVGDTGTIQLNGTRLQVLDTQKVSGGYVLHEVRVIEGELSQKLIGEKAHLAVDSSRRQAIAVNHSATHLVHAALRKVLGNHVKQAGSRVDEQTLRFDYSHFEPVTEDQISEIFGFINDYLRANHEVTTSIMPLEDAKKLGAMALFGEKYGDTVRVVGIGPESLELCGGTHTQRSGDIGSIFLANENGISAGVRRIECYSGVGAFQQLMEERRILASLSENLKCDNQSLLDRFIKVQGRVRSLEQELEAAKSKLVSYSAEGLLSGVRTSPKGVRVVLEKITSSDPETLKSMVDVLRVKLGSGVVALASSKDDSGIIVAGATSDLASKIHIGNLIKAAASETGGKGGGRPDFAQAGGVDPLRLDAALEVIFKGIQ